MKKLLLMAAICGTLFAATGCGVQFDNGSEDSNKGFLPTIEKTYSNDLGVTKKVEYNWKGEEVNTTYGWDSDYVDLGF